MRWASDRRKGNDTFCTGYKGGIYSYYDAYVHEKVLRELGHAFLSVPIESGGLHPHYKHQHSRQSNRQKRTPVECHIHDRLALRTALLPLCPLPLVALSSTPLLIADLHLSPDGQKRYIKAEKISAKEEQQYEFQTAAAAVHSAQQKRGTNNIVTHEKTSHAFVIQHIRKNETTDQQHKVRRKRDTKKARKKATGTQQ